MAWIDACATTQVPSQGGFKLDLPDRSVGVYRCGDTLRAASAICPHAKAFLTEGRVEGDLVICPRHQWRWNLAEGRAQDNSGYALQLYSLRVVDGRVQVDIP